MVDVERGNRWVKKDSVQEKVEAVKPTKVSANSAALLLKESKEPKNSIVAKERD